MTGERLPNEADGRLWLHGVRLEGTDFSGRRVRSLSIAEGSHLTRCDFRRLRATGGGLGGGLRPSTYVECVFDGSRLKRTIPGRATFVACSFQDVEVEEMFFHDAQFVDCMFSGLIKKVAFSAVPLHPDEHLGRTDNAFLRNDFSQARLVDVSFRNGIDLDSQRLPSGPEYLLVRDAAVALEEARTELRQWPDQRDREEAETALGVLGRLVRSGQRDVFTTRSFVAHRIPPVLADRLVAALAAGR